MLLFSVHLNSLPCEQAIVVHNNPAKSGPTPLKGAPNSCTVCFAMVFILPFQGHCILVVFLPIELIRFSMFHSWKKYHQSKEGENDGDLPFWAYQAVQYQWPHHAEWHKREDPRPAAVQDQAQERRGAKLAPSFGYLRETRGPQDEDPHRGGKGEHHDHQNHRLSWPRQCTVPSRRLDFAFLALWVCPQMPNWSVAEEMLI